MNNLRIILNELGYSLRKHNLGYELRHIDRENKHPDLVGKVLLPLNEQDLECVAFFIARKIKILKNN
jgi:hypothetical protein